MQRVVSVKKPVAGRDVGGTPRRNGPMTRSHSAASRRRGGAPARGFAFIPHVSKGGASVRGLRSVGRPGDGAQGPGQEEGLGRGLERRGQEEIVGPPDHVGRAEVLAPYASGS